MSKSNNTSDKLKIPTRRNKTFINSLVLDNQEWRSLLCKADTILPNNVINWHLKLKSISQSDLFNGHFQKIINKNNKAYPIWAWFNEQKSSLMLKTMFFGLMLIVAFIISLFLIDYVISIVVFWFLSILYSGFFFIYNDRTDYDYNSPKFDLDTILALLIIVFIAPLMVFLLMHESFGNLSEHYRIQAPEYEQRYQGSLNPQSIAEHYKHNPYDTLLRTLPIWNLCLLIQQQLNINLIENTEFEKHLTHCQSTHLDPANLLDFDKLNHLLDTVQLLQEQGFEDLQFLQKLEELQLNNPDLYIRKYNRLVNPNSIILDNDLKTTISQVFTLFHDIGIQLDFEQMVAHAMKIANEEPSSVSDMNPVQLLNYQYSKMIALLQEIRKRMVALPEYDFALFQKASHDIQNLYQNGSPHDVGKQVLEYVNNLQTVFKEHTFQIQYQKLLLKNQ